MRKYKVAAVQLDTQNNKEHNIEEIRRFIRQAAEGGAVLAELNWGVFLLAGGLCFLLLSVVFRGSARHAVEGQLRRCSVERRGRRADLTALLDTGHTLSDGLTGRPVLTAHWEALGPLWTEEERCILARLERDGAAACLQAVPGVLAVRRLEVRSMGAGGYRTAGGDIQLPPDAIPYWGEVELELVRS